MGFNNIFMAKDSNTTIDHDEIRQWIEEREGTPAMVRTDGRGEGILRVDLGDSEENLMEISWEDFFKMFEVQNLAFVYQDTGADGEVSMFHAFVARDGEEGDSPIAGFGDDEDEEDEDEDDVPEGFAEAEY